MVECSIPGRCNLFCDVVDKALILIDLTLDTFQAANMTAIVSALAKQQSEGEEEYTSGGGGGVHGPGDSLTSSNGGSYGRHRKTSNSSDESGR